jgi:pyrimidine-nucleoside phosphorylase
LNQEGHVNPVDILRKKRDGHALSAGEIEAFIHGVTQRHWPDYEASALLMAIVLRGMDAEETAALTRAMVHSGVRLDLSDIPGPKVDKHSTGGVGDKTSLVLAPLAAACGVIVPMMSGRGLGHSGGTRDKLEAVPGFRTDLTLEEFRAVLRDAGCALIGPTEEIAPADRILYALRDVTATVESIPLITGSIMSKKIAEGIGGLVMDVKCGKGAFMKTRDEARRLAQSLVVNGQANGVRTEALITAMDQPLGRMVGNSLEVKESLAVLRGEGPQDVRDLSVTLAAWMLRLGGLASTQEEAEKRVVAALDSGAGLEKLRRIIARQGGDPRVIDDPARLPSASHVELVRARRPGYVAEVDAEIIGRATMFLGAGRQRVDDVIDPAVGAILHAKVGDQVREGEALIEVHHRDHGRIGEALALVAGAYRIEDAPPPAMPLILETV